MNYLARHISKPNKRKIGKGGIRTPGDLTATLVFKTRAFDHSATFPFFYFTTKREKKQHFKN